MAEEIKEVIEPKRRPRKTIGEEGSRRQTLFVFLFLLIVGLIFYLPGELKGRPKQTLNFEAPKFMGTKIQIVKKKPVRAGPAETETKIKDIIKDLPGQYGVWANGVKEGVVLQINADKIYTAASVIKLPVLAVYYLAVDNDKLDPEEIYVLREADRWQYGTGSMQHQPAGKEYTYRQVAELVANQSDNMGAEVLIKKLGGYTAVQKEIDKLNLKQTNLKENETSPQDIGGLLLQLAQGKLFSKSSREELFANLTKTINEDRLPKGVPESIRVVHKFGSEAGVVNDCGIVEAIDPYVICVLTTEINSGQAETVLPQISQVVWEWLGD
jgi:beta-lactamase class A